MGQQIAHAQHELAGTQDDDVFMARLKMSHVEGDQPSAFLPHSGQQDRQIFGVSQARIRRKVGYWRVGCDPQAAANDEAKTGQCMRQLLLQIALGLNHYLL